MAPKWRALFEKRVNDYCFFPCMIVSFHAWLLFPSMHDYCFLPCMIVSFHAWLLFSSMHVVSGDRFVSFKAGGNHRDDNFFFYHAGYRTGWTDGRIKTNVAPKDVHALFFLVVGDCNWSLSMPHYCIHGMSSIYSSTPTYLLVKNYCCFSLFFLSPLPSKVLQSISYNSKPH